MRHSPETGASTSTATSFGAGTPACAAVLGDKLLVSSLVQANLDDDTLTLTLELLDSDGSTADLTELPARDSISTYLQADVAVRGSEVLVAFTTSQAGDDRYRWSEIHGAVFRGE